jgi:6-phosphogluconolactonase (cycloisomerase 2 family)
MKFSKLSQLFLVSAIGLILATYLTACNIVTIDYVFVAASASNTAGSDGQIYTYAADSETGALRKGPPVVSSGGTSPVAIAVSGDYYNLYVANQGNNSVVHFSVASNGVLTKKDSVTTATTPVALTVNKAGTYLYVVSGTSSATLTAYSLSSGTIGSAAATVALTVPGYAGDTIIPTAVAALPNNNAVYVAAYDQSAYNPGGSTTSNANPGWVFGFAAGSGGALTVTLGSPYQAGIKPTSLACDPTDRFVYATDFASNELIGFGVQNATSLNFLVNGPFKTGNEPSGVVIDPRGLFMYVSDSLDNSVSGYNIALPTGTPSAIVNSNSSLVYATDTQPVAIAADPALGRFIYTADRVGNSVSGFRLNPETGVLSQTQATPYPTGTAPTALILVPHGNHATQSITP